MVAVRIGGAEAINNVGAEPAPVPRYPIADAAEFGGASAAAEQNLGAAISAIGDHLAERRRVATDQVAQDTASLDYATAAQKATLDLQNQYPTGGKGFTDALKQKLDDLKGTTLDGLNAKGLSVSPVGLDTLNHHFTTAQQNYMLHGVTFENNAQISTLTNTIGENVNKIASDAMSSGDVDSALARVQQTVRSGQGLMPADKLTELNDGAKKQIVTAAINGAIQRGDFDAARNLTTKYFGTTQGGGDLHTTITNHESGGNPSLVNSLGYAGTYQFGAPRLADLGVYTPGPNENLQTWSKTGKADPGKWTGTFSIPGFPQVKTLTDFLGSPDAQKAVYDTHVGEINDQVQKRGLDQYVGKVIGGVPVTSNGIVMMAHLGGIAGAQRFLQSGGSYNPADGNGTHLSDYAKVGGQTKDVQVASAGSQGDQPGPVMPDPDAALKLNAQITRAHGAALLDQERAIKLQNDQAKQVSDKAEDETFAKIVNKDQSVTATSIVGDNRLLAGRKQHLVDLLTKATKDKDSGTYGSGYYDLFKQVHADAGDPRKITDPAQLVPHVGEDGDLTIAGLDKLRGEIAGKKTPEGEAEAAMKKQLFKYAESQLSAKNDLLHIKDPKGEENLLKWMAQFYSSYDKEKAAGKTPAQLLTPDSSDYLGKSVTALKRTPGQINADLLSANGMGATPAKGIDTSTAQGLISAVQSGKMSREEGEALALKNGWIRASAPTPAPVPSVPISR